MATRREALFVGRFFAFLGCLFVRRRTPVRLCRFSHIESRHNNIHVHGSIKSLEPSTDNQREADFGAGLMETPQVP